MLLRIALMRERNLKIVPNGKKREQCVSRDFCKNLATYDIIDTDTGVTYPACSLHALKVAMKIFNNDFTRRIKRDRIAVCSLGARMRKDSRI